MPRCTMPYMPWFRTWFNNKFGDLCDIHDFNYRSGYPRKKADLEFACSIMLRGYFIFGVLSYLAVRIFGITHYVKTRNER